MYLLPMILECRYEASPVTLVKPNSERYNDSFQQLLDLCHVIVTDMMVLDIWRFHKVLSVVDFVLVNLCLPRYPYHFRASVLQ